MIDLTIQIKLIIFSFIFGFLFSIVLNIFNFRIKRFSKILEMFFSLLLIIFLTIIYFVGIQKISNALFHIYSIIFIIIGFVSYDILLKLIANNNKK